MTKRSGRMNEEWLDMYALSIVRNVRAQVCVLSS